jgi:hypothetical protein
MRRATRSMLAPAAWPEMSWIIAQNTGRIDSGAAMTGGRRRWPWRARDISTPWRSWCTARRGCWRNEPSPSASQMLPSRPSAHCAALSATRSSRYCDSRRCRSVARMRSRGRSRRSGRTGVSRGGWAGAPLDGVAGRGDAELAGACCAGRVAVGGAGTEVRRVPPKNSGVSGLAAPVLKTRVNSRLIG